MREGARHVNTRDEIRAQWLKIDKAPSDRVVEFFEAVRALDLKTPPTYEFRVAAREDGLVVVRLYGYKFDAEQADTNQRAVRRRAYLSAEVTTDLIDLADMAVEDLARMTLTDAWEDFHAGHLAEWLDR